MKHSMHYSGSTKEFICADCSFICVDEKEAEKHERESNKYIKEDLRNILDKCPECGRPLGIFCRLHLS